MTVQAHLAPDIVLCVPVAGVEATIANKVVMSEWLLDEAVCAPMTLASDPFNASICDERLHRRVVSRA